MDAATIQAKIYAGYGKAAVRVGYVYTHYRPSNARNALAAWNKVGTLNAAFDNANEANFPYDKPNDYKGILWSGLFDATNVLPGDYLVYGSKTFYMAGKQDLLPPLCVECSRTFSVLRDNTSVQVGAVGYGGMSPANETLIASGFPGAMQITRQGATSLDHLPSDIERKGGWYIYLPVIPGVTIQERDVISDDLNRRHLVMAVYLSDLGYLIKAEYLETASS